MDLKLPAAYRISTEVSRAINRNLPVVALESAVITHGLPHPTNRELAADMESIVKEGGATPATIALINGKVAIGITTKELADLATLKDVIKVSTRNIGIGTAGGFYGGTTVAATLLAAKTARIKVFATGGIGGVHRGSYFDISTDLDELAKSPVIVVCSGAKAILDLPATLEALETRGVPVLGYQTDDFPAFYSRSSGLKLDYRVDSAAEIVKIAKAHWEVGNPSAVLVCQPPSPENSIDGAEIDEVIAKAVKEAIKKKITGAAVSPFLLARVSQLTAGKSMHVNLALLKNNAKLAAEIAVEFHMSKQIVF